MRALYAKNERRIGREASFRIAEVRGVRPLSSTNKITNAFRAFFCYHFAMPFDSQYAIGIGGVSSVHCLLHNMLPVHGEPLELVLGTYSPTPELRERMQEYLELSALTLHTLPRGDKALCASFKAVLEAVRQFDASFTSSWVSAAEREGLRQQHAKRADRVQELYEAFRTKWHASLSGPAAG